MATASLVLGLVGLFFSWVTFGIPSLLAVVFGFVGISQTKDGQRSGRGMAIAGLFLGGIVLVFAIWVSAVFIYAVGSSGSTS